MEMYVCRDTLLSLIVTSVVMVTCDPVSGHWPPCDVTITEANYNFPGVRGLQGWILDILPSSPNPCSLPVGYFLDIRDKRVGLSALAVSVDVRCPLGGSHVVHVQSPDQYDAVNSTVVGPEVYDIGLRDCSMSWSDVVRIAFVTEVTNRIGLSALTLLPQYNNDTMDTNRAPGIGAFDWYSSIDCIRDNLNIPVQWHHDTKNSCPLSTKEDGTEMFARLQENVDGSFPNLDRLVINGLNFDDVRTGPADLKKFGEISWYALQRNNLSSIPSCYFPKNRTRLNHTVLEPVLSNLNAYKHINILPSEQTKMKMLMDLTHEKIQKSYRLRYLEVQYNNIKEIPHSEQYDRVDVVDLSSNKLGPDSLKGLYDFKNSYVIALGRNNLERLPGDIFLGMNKLEVLSLSYCNIDSVNNIIWTDNVNLKHLNLDFNSLSNLDGVLLNVSDSLLQLVANGNNIAQIPPLPVWQMTTNQLTFINLAQNSFTEFPVEVFTFPQLFDVSLSFNQINTEGIKRILNSTIYRFTDSGELRIFRLEYNCIEYIPLATPSEVEALNSVLRVAILTLLGNPLHCGCREFKDWLITAGVDEENVQLNVFCEPDLYAKVFNPIFLEYLETMYTEPSCILQPDGAYPYRCQADIKKIHTIIISIGCGLCFVVSMLITFLCYRYRRYVKTYWYICTGLRLQIRLNLAKKDRKLYKYDAYVAYHGHEEFDWVVYTLKYRMEVTTQPPFQLCIQDRDFEIGNDMVANIVNAMEVSARSILVISRSSIDSEWGRFQLLNALWEGSLRNKHNYIVPVLFPDVKFSEISRRMRIALRSVPILRIGDRYFWEKLEIAMRDRRANDEQNQIENDGILFESAV